MTQNEECGGTYIGVSECTRREEYDGIGGGSKWGVENTAVWGRPFCMPSSPLRIMPWNTACFLQMMEYMLYGPVKIHISFAVI